MTPPASPDITLQVNLCAGDLAYAERILAALVATHRGDVREVVVVADSCRPQSTRELHAPTRFPSAEFARRIGELRELCAKLQGSGLVDRVVWLEPDPGRLRALNGKYAGVATADSHDHLGHAFSAYFLGWDSARTRYVAHFDADILLRQEPGYSWLRAAVAALADDATLVAASPRIAPPPADGAMVRIDAPGSGWLPSWPLEPVPAGWKSPWFSTRCHLMDRERLARMLPLTGWRDHRRAAGVTRLFSAAFGVGALTAAGRSPLARRVMDRLPAFPLPPEVLLHEHAQDRRFGCLYLRDSRAWFIHPDTKPEIFLRLLPRFLESVTTDGTVPAAQRGASGIQFAAWESAAAAT